MFTPSFFANRLNPSTVVKSTTSTPAYILTLRWLISLSVLITLGTGVVGAAWQNTLSTQDVAQLSTTAIVEHQKTNRFRNNSKSEHLPGTPDHLLGIEVLMVELQEKKSRKPDDPRVAEVFTYDYSAESAQVMLIDVDTLELISTRAITHIHLPLNQHEIDVVIQILLDDQRIITALESEYLARFGNRLNSLAELDMKVSIWDPDPNNTDTVCETTRCALVSVFTDDYYNFSIEPIVVLNSAAVHMDWVQ